MLLTEVRDVFNAIYNKHVYHYSCLEKPKPLRYIVWAEEGQTGASHSDNIMNIQVYGGTIDLFTKDEYDPLFDNVQTAMNKAGMAWSWNSTQYEEDTGYIHHEWIWEVDRTI